MATNPDPHRRADEREDQVSKEQTLGSRYRHYRARADMVTLVCHICGKIVKIPIHKIPERDGVMLCPRCGNGRSIWRGMPSE